VLSTALSEFQRAQAFCPLPLAFRRGLLARVHCSRYASISATYADESPGYSHRRNSSDSEASDSLSDSLAIQSPQKCRLLDCVCRVHLSNDLFFNLGLAPMLGQGDSL
jgi:hypothetical protein